MTVHAEIIREEMAKDSVRFLPFSYTILEAEDDNELFALFFREYDNRYKYCNSIQYSFTEQDMRKQYHEWFCDVKNYANNGGDMW